MMSKIFRLVYLVLFTQVLLSPLQAQSPPRIRTTSNLKDAKGAAVADGIYNIIFRMYYEESGGTVLWTESASVTVKGGIYTHLLGSITPLTSINFNHTLFLGIQIGDYELSPRTELTYAPYAVASQYVVCTGAVGDVKYSLLNPTQFATVNGECWVPLDGSSIPNSRLSNTFGISNAPDGSGLFIRSQEFAGGANNDPDRTSISSIATIQADAVIAHNHTINYGGSHSHGYSDTYQQFTDAHTYGGLVNNGNYPIGGQGFTDAARTTSAATSGISLNNNSGAETRPKNLNIWAYIRIN